MTNDVQLRDVAMSDLPVFFAQQLDPNATRMAAFPARDRDSFTKHWMNILGDETVTKMTCTINVTSFPSPGDRRNVTLGIELN